MNSRKSRELLFALIAVVFITLVYLGMNIILGEIPAASSLYGHSMGILGFLLMVMTETLYSLRKRSHLAHWGPMSSWLQFHIFTGIVGPYLVLLHSSWKFNGVAGVLTLLTGIIVLSGFIGRYIYTAVPRTADGLIMEAEELKRQIQAAERRVQSWALNHQNLSPALLTQIKEHKTGDVVGDSRSVLSRGMIEGWHWISAWLKTLKLDASRRKEARELNQLLRRRDTLRRQAASLQTARKLLATWHVIHIPIGMGLFALAFVHIAAAIYYALMLW